MSVDDTFYTKNHKRLDWIALFAKILSWIALFVAIIAPLAHFFQTKISLEFQMQMNMFGNQTARNFGELLVEETLFSLSMFFEMFNFFFKGLVYVVVLKAISLALYMIIEIDLNYSLFTEGE